MTSDGLTNDADDRYDYDLIVIGTGSGNSLIGPEMDHWRIAIVERDPVFGGTCLNRGCIPTKMFVYAAEVAELARRGPRYGVHTEMLGVDWPAIVERIFGRIDPIAAGGRDYRIGLANVDVFHATARFVGHRAVDVGDRVITGRQVVIAAGARPHIPDGVPGLDPACGPVVPFHTSDTIMRIPSLPQRLVVLGGGFVACEMASVFAAFGVDVVNINRSTRLLRGEDHEVSERYTEIAARRMELVLGAELQRVNGDERGVEVVATVDGVATTVTGDLLLVATGRIPNGDQLDACAGGVELHADGSVVVDDYGRTSAPGVWALGDVDGRHQLKHMANGEAKVVRHNLSHPHDLRVFDARPAPHGVFGDPQIGAVGLTEHEARIALGDDAVVISHPFGDAAMGWAMEDTDGFAKLIGDRRTRLVVGAHLIGPHSPSLVQQLVQGIHLGTTVDEMATGQIWIHPALAEVVEQALLKLAEAMDEAVDAAGVEQSAGV